MRYVYLLLATKYHPLGANMISFHQNVSMQSYGDDNLVGVSAYYISWFNQTTIAQGYAEIGMTYTDENKSGLEVLSRPITDVSFLKRKFVRMAEVGRVVAPLDLSVCLEMMNWVRGDDDPVLSCEENISTALFELSLHGEAVYEHWRARIRSVCRIKNLNVVRPRWSEMIHFRLASAALPAHEG